MSKSIEIEVEELDVEEEEKIIENNSMIFEERSLYDDISDIKRRIEYNGKQNRLLMIIIIMIEIMIFGLILLRTF